MSSTSQRRAAPGCGGALGARQAPRAKGGRQRRRAARGMGRKRLLDFLYVLRWIEVQIKIDPKLYYAPQQCVFQHTSYVVIDTKGTNEYVDFVAALSEFQQEIAMLPQLCN